MLTVKDENHLKITNFELPTHNTKYILLNPAEL